MNLFHKNLTLLRQRNPALARRVERVSVPSNLVIGRAQSGRPVVSLDGINLHSVYDPVKEADKLVMDWNPESGHSPVVWGLGLGYHLDALLKKAPEGLTVVEPRVEIFRAFLENVDYSPFADKVHFEIGQPVPRLVARRNVWSWDVWQHPASVRISQTYFDELQRALRLNELLAENALRILVVNPIYGGSLPTAHFSAHALKKMGHVVETVDCERFESGFFAIKEVARQKNHSEVLARNFMNLMHEVVAAKAVEFMPDLILVLAQAPVSPELVTRLKALGAPVVFWFVEDFRTLTYWKDVASAYDCVFTLQPGEFLNELKAIGVPQAHYLPQAAWPDVQRPLPLDEIPKNYRASVSFMGAAYYNRIQSFTRLLDFDFKIWGTGWDRNSIFGPHLQNNGGRINEADCVRIYNGSLININLHSSTCHEGVNPQGDFVNPRTFEIAACRAFQLVDVRSELDELFRLDEEIITFDSINDLRDKTRYYLNHDVERLTVAEKGYKRVLREHTHEHRMREMLLYVFLEREAVLRERISSRQNPVELALKEAGHDSELAALLEKYRWEPEFSYKKVVEDIKNGEGRLARPELLFLMLDQVLKETS